MDVVRFKESDVIVASGKFLTLTGYANTTPRDGKMSFDGKDYSNQDIESNLAGFLSDVQKSFPGAGNVNIMKKTGQVESASDFANYDHWGMAIDGADGEYEFNKDLGLFTKKI